MDDGFPEEVSVSDPFKGLDEVEQYNAIDELAFNCMLGPRCLFPCCDVGSLRRASIEVRSVVGPFPTCRELPSRPHPYTGQPWDEADGAETTVGLGQQNNDDQLNCFGPVTCPFSAGEQCDD